MTVERAGLGLSTFVPAYTFRNFSDDVAQLCTQLGLNHVLLLGYSAGTPWALAVAHYLPHLVTHVSLVSAISPPEVRWRACHPAPRIAFPPPAPTCMQPCISDTMSHTPRLILAEG